MTMYIGYNSTFENPAFYRVDSTYAFGGQDGLKLQDHRIGRCAGSSWLYLDPLWFGGKTKRSYRKDQFASFLEELKPALPMLPRHFPLEATWELTPEEQGALDRFNDEFSRTLSSPLERNARLLVMKIFNHTVFVDDGKFVVEQWSADGERREVVDKKPGLTPKQADEALAEWRWRTSLK
jgi:hypothetical protein